MKTTNSLLILLAAGVAGMTENAHAFNQAYSKSVGNSTLGAAFDCRLSDKFTTSSYDVTASANGTAKLLGSSYKVIEGNAGAGVSMKAVTSGTGAVLGYTLGASAHGDVVLKACGIILQDIHRTASVNASGKATLPSKVIGVDRAPLFGVVGSAVSSNKLISLDVATKVKEKTFASARFMVGPIPVKVSAGASVGIGAHGSISLVSRNGVPALDANMGPSAEAAVVASAGVDAVVASAGVEAKATIVKVSPTANAVLSTSSDFATGTLDYGAALQYQGVNGYIRLFAEVDTWLWSHKWTKTIASFGDGVHNFSLLSGSAQLWKVGGTKLPLAVRPVTIALLK